ncbi:hypothetical protein SmJEL517_g04186 [Synchytrium microbalum]|uniref:DNA damage-inducible protein 1 n=1 Tax=Synchytrium microbalum TaxID=1806994 RepID=A0A507C0U8_9FUNG|nr:uncharacterized protein SmJEL517_g04186 [Synchytrium microbalum]TPX32679.1 hypothetical protein SmJEL517_g04186 [Synchytrium microbalum]
MRISLTNEFGDLHNLEVDSTISIQNLKALAEAELRIPANAQTILHNGVELLDVSKTLQELGVAQDDILFVKRAGTAAGGVGAAGGRPVGDPAEALRQQLLSDPRAMTQLASRNPQLAAAALEDPEQFRRMIMDIERQRREYEERAAAEMAALDDDPFNPEAQRRIEEAIRQKNVDENMEAAMEYNPESFGRVIMLYINTEVNSIPVKAFVDSGAQATIMSPECAEKCKILHLLDKRFAGVAIGVGQAKILGRVHAAPFKIGGQVLMCSFTIMEGKGVDLLFGLDMLKRHQACIDLKKNVLVINEEDIPFLSEHELPDKAKWETSGSPMATSPTQPSGQPLGGPSSSSSSVPPSSRPPAQAAGNAAAARAAGVGGANNSNNPAAAKYPEASIQSLVDLGATRAEAIAALDASGGNPDVAANMFFG